jgi:hypothetical protein
MGFFERSGLDGVTGLIQIFSKWFFDLLKDAAVVAGLLIAAQESDSKLLTIFAYCCYLILNVYVISCVIDCRIAIFKKYNYPLIRFALSMSSILMFSMAASAGIIFGFQYSIEIIITALQRN